MRNFCNDRLDETGGGVAIIVVGKNVFETVKDKLKQK